MSVKIHHIVTAELESPLAVSLLGSGVDPNLSREQVLPYGYRYDIKRSDGTVVEGVMVPAPVWLLEGAERVILIDAGVGDVEEYVTITKRHGFDSVTSRSEDQDIVAGLAAHGVTPADVEMVVLTHLHSDHIGNTELFPNARFVVQADELPWGIAPPRWATFYYPEFASKLTAVLDRVDIVDGDVQIDANVRLLKIGGHTAGCMATLVDTEVGCVCLTSDIVYNYRNLELNWPQGAFWNLPELMNGWERLRSEADIIVPEHDWMFREKYPDGTIG